VYPVFILFGIVEFGHYIKIAVNRWLFSRNQPLVGLKVPALAMRA
jgi:hypothetical protein